MDERVGARSQVRTTLDATLDSGLFGAIMALATLFSLFGEDVRVSATSRSADFGFLVVTAVVLALFAIEMLLLAATREGYILPSPSPPKAPGIDAGEPSPMSPTHMPGQGGESGSPGGVSPRSLYGAEGGESQTPRLRASILQLQNTAAYSACAAVYSALLACFSVGSLQFWLDALALASMAVDVIVIAQDLQPSDGRATALSQDSANRAAFISFARTGRASRAGARAGRLLRLFRIFATMASAASSQREAGKAVTQPAAGVSSASALTSPTSAALSAGGRGFSGTAGKEGGKDEDKEDSTGKNKQGRKNATPWLLMSSLRGFQARYEKARQSVSRETRVGARLTEIMTRRVVLGVLLLVLAVPLLTFQPVDESRDFSAEHTHAFAVLAAADPATYTPALTAALIALNNQMGPGSSSSLWHVAAMELNGTSVAQRLPLDGQLNGTQWVYTTKPPSDFRRSALSDIMCISSIWWNSSSASYVVPELSTFQRTSCTATRAAALAAAAAGGKGESSATEGLVAVTFTTRLWFDVLDSVSLEASNNAWLTIVVLLTIALGSAMFTLATSRLVLQPLEKMVLVVQRLTANPLASPAELLAGTGKTGKGAATSTLFEASHLELSNPQVALIGPYARPAKQSARMLALEQDGTEATETRVLLRSLLNMGPLLRAGFGHAGARTITSNLTPQGELLPTRAGKMVHAIFMHVRLKHVQEIADGMVEPETTASDPAGGSPTSVPTSLPARLLPTAQPEEAVLLANAVLTVVHGVAVAHGARVLTNTAEGSTLAWVLPPPDASAAQLPDGRTPWTAVADTARLAVLRMQVELARLSGEIVGLPIHGNATFSRVEEEEDDDSPEDVTGIDDEVVQVEVGNDRLPRVGSSIRGTGQGEGIGIQGVTRPHTANNPHAGGLFVHSEQEDPQPEHLLSLRTRKALQRLLYDDWLRERRAGARGVQEVFYPDACTLLTAGLHAGWGIECAMGSDKKLGAGIIGPHVDVPAMLSAWLLGGEAALQACGGSSSSSSSSSSSMDGQNARSMVQQAQVMMSILQEQARIQPLDISQPNAAPVSCTSVALTHPMASLLTPLVKASCVPFHALRMRHATSVSGDGLPIGFEPWAVPKVGLEPEHGRGFIDPDARSWDASSLSTQVLGCSPGWADQVRMLTMAARCRDSWRGTMVLYTAGAHTGMLHAVARAVHAGQSLDSLDSSASAGPGLPSFARLAAVAHATAEERPRLPDPSLAWPRAQGDTSLSLTAASGQPAPPNRSDSAGGWLEAAASRSSPALQSWALWDAASLWKEGIHTRAASANAASVEARDAVRLASCAPPEAGLACLSQALKLLLGPYVAAALDGFDGEEDAVQADCAIRTVQEQWKAAQEVAVQALQGAVGIHADTRLSTHECAAASLLLLACHSYGLHCASHMLALLCDKGEAQEEGGKEDMDQPLLPHVLSYLAHPDGISQRAALLDGVYDPLPVPSSSLVTAPDGHGESLASAPASAVGVDEQAEREAGDEGSAGSFESGQQGQLKGNHSDGADGSAGEGADEAM